MQSAGTPVTKYTCIASLVHSRGKCQLQWAWRSHFAITLRGTGLRGWHARGRGERGWLVRMGAGQGRPSKPIGAGMDMARL